MKARFTWLLATLVVALVLTPTTMTALGQDDQKKKDDEKKDSVAERLSDARGKAQTGDLEGALKIVDGIIKDHPKSKESLFFGAQLQHFKGIQIVQGDGERVAANKYLYQCAKYMRQFRKLQKELNGQQANFYAIAIYNEACSYAIDGKKEKALATLKESIKDGFDQIETLENDTDFASIKDSEEFKAIVAELRKKLDG